MGILLQIIRNYGIAFIGGGLFTYFNFPLPWVLGAMFATLIWKSFGERDVLLPVQLKNASFIVLGASFGLQFTLSTMETVVPYLLPYLAGTAVLIAASVVFGLFFAKLTHIDGISSIYGSIPGGLAEMIAASESLGANSSTVVFMQSVRLLAVLSCVPFAVTHFFTTTGGSAAALVIVPAEALNPLLYAWFLIPAFGGWLGRNVIPASYVLVPMAVTAVINIFFIQMPVFPHSITVWAQLTLGIGLGKSVSIRDLKLMGKYSGWVTSFALLLISVSFGIGWFFTTVTDMDLQTAMLSIAPGGLLEMALTATSVGADATVVSALQTIRVLIIIVFVPILLKWWFTMRKQM